MKITKVEVIPISTPMKRAQLMRGATLARIDGVLLKLHSDEGLVGIADAGDTSSWYRGETQDSITSMICDFFAPKVLLGEDPTKIEKIVGRMDILTRDNNQAKATVDFALHDLVGKRFGVPVYQLLGGKTIERIPLGLVLGAGEPEAVAEEALAVLREGFHFVKLKAGGPLKADIAMVAEVRRAVGDDVDLFIDINGAWTYDQALTTIRALEKYNLSKIEQPLPAWDLDGMARLRGKVATPIYADESAQELHDLLAIINKGAADGLMIKTQKAGGLLKAQRWLTLARLANLPVICGCMVGSGLEASPAAHLLAANDWIAQFPQENAGPLHIHDCLNSRDIDNDIALNVPRFEGGYLYPNDGPGLGIELNEDLVRRLVTPGKAARVVTA
ncbi:mandelate racemase/muconate lactonizing enzyme family protein [Aromatoleum aromaticum]|uniref:Mandelate racemase/muconate lactonizing enzyme family protein n=1 Tax=Aromatoleum aromaticum (strain DSM 19018 / LMG 30748 / EbN1) TaxID=76114 RepID=Q5P025_AROAE|nr:enolase C-terminal domain-like protein [Aromatoleum aromaticum]NMG54847.1 mandelate racemase [Aromatoleum aromaticum]NMG54855.1 mandelate racemase [Aromatoleum aromaticum]CAI09331.1 Mandelate racemase/muconate lactonizing enzyme family protein [Aromatoleum aromaticum EbN1]CAI09339.1 Mandelate racemase/muconate lactonizing enzyme family protein [Aromatoleum aromaticum EbN1]